MNIYDIAKLSGVSIATVSRVVNGSEKVSEKTRSKVLDIIRQEGYTPNVFAQGLGIGTMHTVGILVPTISDQYMAKCVSYLEDQLTVHGYDCILSCSGFSIEGKAARTQMLLSKHIDALVFVGSTYSGSGESEEETDYIREAAKQAPVFIINGYVKGDNVFCRLCDDRTAMREAVEALLAHGRKDILFLTDSRSYSAREKTAGCIEALEGAGIPVRDEMFLHTENRIHAVRDYLLSINPVFDAAVATDDGIAIGAVKFAQEKGLSVPGDLCVIGYNNSSLAVACNPELTSIDSRAELLCRETIDNILAILHGDASIPACSIQPGRLISRKTTDF